MSDRPVTTCGKTDNIRVAAVGDVHCGIDSRGTLEPLLRQISAAADILVLCGDLTNHGLVTEADVLARELSATAKLTTLAVLGNHDYEAGQAQAIERMLGDAGVIMLDGDAREICGVGFAGVKGFGGGFGRATLAAFGEPAIKRFVQEAVDEAMKLEKALQQLRTPHRVAVLHYSPVHDTVQGEPVEIFSWLGCSRLEEPLNRYQVTAAVHGHAHKGAPEGRTSTGVPVYNVALPVMRRSYPDRPPFRLLTFPAVPQSSGNGHVPTGEPVETTVR